MKNILILVIIFIGSIGTSLFAHTKVRSKYTAHFIIGLNKDDSLKKCVDHFLVDLEKFNIDSAQIIELPLVKEARKFYYLKEIAGDRNEEQIITFFKAVGVKKVNSEDESWCSVFISYCAKNAGFEYPKSSVAKNWLNFGETITNPLPGDLVIFWRDSPTYWSGHVAIYLGERSENGDLVCLGGNQNDMVCIRTYSKEKVLGYRRLNN